VPARLYPKLLAPFLQDAFCFIRIYGTGLIYGENRITAIENPIIGDIDDQKDISKKK
jgi:hypothetical protein